MKGIRSLFLSILLAPFLADAAPITFDFSGTATDLSGIFAGPSNTVTGSFTYDSDLVETISAGTPGGDVFSGSATVNNQFQWGIEIAVNGITRTTADNLNNQSFNTHHRVSVTDNLVEGDNFFYEAFSRTSANGAILPDDRAIIRLFDPTRTAITPGVLQLTGVAPIDLDLALFSTANGFYVANDADTTSNFTRPIEVGAVTFTIQSLSKRNSVHVTEPSTMLLFGLGIIGIGAARRLKRS